MTGRRPVLWIIAGILSVLILSSVQIVRAFQKKNTKPMPALASSGGTPIFLDFNTPTPTFTPTPTPTPTDTPTPTPSPSPTPTPYPVTSSQLDAWFTQYANHYSVDRSLLWKIAACETGLRTNAINGIYGGMFQFSANTWISNRRLMNLNGDPSLRFNPEEAIKTAAFLLSTRGAGAWPHCGH